MKRKTDSGIRTKNGSICTAVTFVLMMGSLTLPAWVIEDGTPEWSAVKVLHVYVCEGYDEVQEVLRIAGASALFDVTEVSLAAFNGGQPSDLSQHDVVTFGLSDCYDRGTYIGRISELRTYVENGGGVVWTHDTLEWPQYYGPDAELPAGMIYTGPTTLRLMYEAQVVLDHEVLHVPFEIGNVGDVIPIQETHENGGVVTTADLILKFSKMNDGGKNHYLTTHEWMNGRVVVDEIGHKIFDCEKNFLGWPSVIESRIFANALCWAGKCDLTQAPLADAGPDQTVYEGNLVQFNGTGSSSYENLNWDFNSFFDSDGDGNCTNDVDATDLEPTHTYGDDGNFIVTLRVTGQQGQTDIDTMAVKVSNVPPTLAEDVKASLTGDITLRVAGEKWHDVEMDLYQNAVEIASASVTRSPGSPDDQAVTVGGLTLDMMGGAISAIVEYTPMDDPINGQVSGASPAWLIFTPQGGEEVRLQHNFNVRHPDTWLWTVDDFRTFLIGTDITFEATAADPGSDDLKFVWDWDDGSSTSTDYYNDGVGPDLYPSPEVNPMGATDVQIHAYGTSGTYSVKLTVVDDDGGVVSQSFVLTI